MTATSGTLAIAPEAMTRAMCEPGAIDTRLARGLVFVTSYLMSGAKLHRALK